MDETPLSPVNTRTSYTQPRILKNGLVEVSKGTDTPSLDIVFVHGLEGHPEKTWTAKPSDKPGNSRSSRFRHIRRGVNKIGKTFKKNESVSVEDIGEDQDPCFWPRDLLANDIPDARVFTYGYDSSVSHFFNGPANTSDIHSHGRDLLRRVSARRQQCRGRPLMFITHSLGGLVVKSALRLASEAEKDDHHLRDINKSTIAVLFFGTPHRGSAWVDASKIAARFAGFFGFSASRANLELITPNNPLLEMLRDDFTKRLDRDKVKVTSFQEQKGCKAVNGFDELIVEPDSSAIGHRSENKQPINANHVDMCKFLRSGETRATYDQVVLPEIRRHIEDVDDEVGKSISALGAFQKHLDARRYQMENPYQKTLSWLLCDGPDGPGLSEWLSLDSPIYWIQGLPGSGKSTAMKNLVESKTVQKTLRDAGWSSASMFLSDRIEKDNRSWKGVLGAMLFQVLHEQKQRLLPLLRSYILPLLRGPGTEQDGKDPETSFDWSFDRLKEVLLQCREQKVVKFRWCFFIDALDEHNKSELPGSESIVEFLEQLVSPSKSGYGSFKFCLASRPDNEYYIPLIYYPGLKMQDWTRNDISKFVSDKLMSQPDAIDPERPASYREDLRQICDTIVKESHGLFIWVRLIVEEVMNGINDGIPLPRLLGDLNRVPKEELPDFYLDILCKRPKETMRSSHAVLETVLRAQNPVSVLDIGILLEVLPTRPDLEPVPSFSNKRLLELCNDGVNLERRIKRLTGGLLQVVRPNQLGKTDMFHGMGTGGSEQVVHSPTWRVQFLHQTVKEFLQDQLLKPRIDEILLKWPDKLVSTDCMYNGHVFHLNLAAIALQLPENARRQSLWKLDPLEIVIQHAPNAEFLTKRSLFSLLNSLDRLCSKRSTRGERWVSNYSKGKDETWVLTFLAFCVSSDMRLFVADALSHDETRISKHGRPLLHFAGWFPGGFPLPQMAEILLKAKADPNGEFDEKRLYDRSKTALESIMYDKLERDGQSHRDYIKLLICWGANVTRKTNEEWTTVLHAIASMAVDWDKKMDIIRIIPEKCDLNLKNQHNQTVFELLILSANKHNEPLTERHLQKLLERGAKVTPKLARDICTKRLQPSIRNTFTLEAFLNAEYYSSEAERFMEKHFHGWDKSRWPRLKKLAAKYLKR